MTSLAAYSSQPDALRHAHRAVFSLATDPVLVVDAEQRLIDLNLAARRDLGLEPRQALGQPAAHVLAYWPRLVAGEDVPVSAGGDMGSTRLLASLRPFYDEDGRVAGRVVLYRAAEGQPVAGEAANMGWPAPRPAGSGSEPVSGRQEQAVAQLTWHGEEERLAQRVADQSRKLAALYEVILIGGQSLEIGDMLDQSLAIILAVVGGQAACIHLRDGASGRLLLAAQRGLSGETQQQIQSLPPDWLPKDEVSRVVEDLAGAAHMPLPMRLPGFGACLVAPIHERDQAAGTLSIFWTDRRPFPVEDIALFSAVADQLGIILENAKLRQRGEAAAVLKERRRLARDLHDLVTQSLYSLVLAADTATNRLRRGNLNRLEVSLNQMAEAARQALKDMRLLLYELRLTPLEEINLVEALQLRLESVEKRAGVEAHLDMEGPPLWPNAWEGEAYRIAMEALNNALRHARAARVSIRLRGGVDRLELTVADDGQGFDATRPYRGGWGLRNMAERAERLGGRLTINSAAGAGTQITLVVTGDAKAGP